MSDSLDTQNKRSQQVESLVLLDRTIRKMFTNMVPFKWRDIDNQTVPHLRGIQTECVFAI